MEKKNLALTFGATDNYTFALCNVLLGIKKYTSPFWDDIIVFHTDITEKNQCVINSILPCTFVKVDDEEWIEKLTKNLDDQSIKMYSLATMFRYYCFDYLKCYRKVIWLDCDILIQNDISGMSKYGEKTGYAACYADNMAPVEMCFKRVIPGYSMFVPLVNAGTLVLTDKLTNYENLCQWCKDKTVELANDLDMPDQGILNLMLQEFGVEAEPIDVTKYQCHPQAPMAVFPETAFIVHAYGIRKFWNDSIYQNMFPEWNVFNDEYISLAEKILHKKIEKEWGMPLVSVIMSPYTRDEFLMEAIQSILNQSYRNFEFIIVVEYSDKQKTIAEKIEEIKDKRIRIVKNTKKLGFANSLNVALDLAQGKYIARMDDDDISYPDRFQKQVDYLEAHPEIGILGTHAETFMTRHDLWNKYPVDPEYAAIELLRGTVLCHPTVMMRRSVLERHHLRYDPSVFTEDYDLWARAVQYTKISNIPEILFGYRASGLNITVNQEVNINNAHLDVMRRQLKNYLNIEATDDELCLFSSRIDVRAMVYTKNRSAADKVFNEFTRKIANANKACGFYNQEKLEIYLNLRDAGARASMTKSKTTSTVVSKETWNQRFVKLIKKIFKPLADQLVWTFSRRTYDLINTRADSLNSMISRQQLLLQKGQDGQEEVNQRLELSVKKLEDSVNELHSLACQMESSILNRMSEVENSVNTHALWNTDDIQKEIFNLRFLYEKTENILNAEPSSSNVYSKAFYENNRYHSVQSAYSVLSKVIPVVHPDSVIDIGCGSGTWLYAASRMGVSEILGVDGDWVAENELMIPKESFTRHNLEDQLRLNKRYDMAMSLEVAEHLPECCADILIQSICDASDIVLFSAAHENQGGDNHINEQPLEYWKQKFEARGYHWIDIRGLIASDNRVADWYKQNIGLYVQGKLMYDRIMIEFFNNTDDTK